MPLEAETLSHAADRGKEQAGTDKGTQFDLRASLFVKKGVPDGHDAVSAMWTADLDDDGHVPGLRIQDEASGCRRRNGDVALE